MAIENEDLKGRVHSVESFGTLDGPGIRYILFLQGCALQCLYCHNPDARIINGGREVTVGEVIRDIATYHSFIKKGGVTLSGGEPLLQPEFCLALINACASMGLHTAIDTAGAVALAKVRAVIDAVDLILLDIKMLDDDLCRKLTGCGSGETLALLEYCESHHKKIWLRHVLVPGYTLDAQHLTRLADHVLRYTCVKKVELLPYHTMGVYKWERLGLTYPLAGVPSPSDQEVEMAKKIFRERGLL